MKRCTLTGDFNKLPIENHLTSIVKKSKHQIAHTNLIRLAILSVFMILLHGSYSNMYAQTNTWDGSSSSNWNTAANWSLNLVPTAAHDVVIPNNFNVTVNTAAVCKSFTINSGSNSNTITISSGQSLTVTNAVTINGGSGSGDNKTIAVGSGTFSCGSLSMVDPGNDNRDCILSISTGSATVTGNITMAGSALRNQVTFTGAGTLNLGGSISGGDLIPASGSIVNYNGSSAQTIAVNATYVYTNLNINNTAGATLQAAVTTSNVTGNIRVQTGTFNNGGFAIAGNSGATFEVSNGATFQLTGTSGMVTGFGTISLGSSSTVNYAGAAQTVASRTYGNLSLSGSSTKTAAGAITVSGTTTLNGITFKSGSTTGYSSSLGILLMASSSTLSLGTGVHTLTLSNSSAASWTGTLTISGWGTGTAGIIQVGTGGLSAAQLSQVTFSGYSAGAIISASGQLFPRSNWQSEFISMNIGSSTWCAGETRIITVTVKNIGTSTWTDATPEVNIGVKWNADADYNVRVDAGGLTAGSTQTYSLTVTAPSTAGSNNLTFDVVKEGDCWFGNNSGSCGPGNSVFTSSSLTINANPAQPSTITGSTSPCVGSSQTYSVTNVSGVTYNWTFPSGWTQTGGTTTNSVTVTVGANSGNVTVTPSAGSCSGTARSLAVTTSSAPAQPSAITGNSTPCQASSQTYSVTNVSGTTYTWSFPSGWSQTGGGTTNSVTVTVGATSGNVQVTPSNSCGNGTARTLSATVSLLPAQPGAISGSASPCSGTSQTYSVTNVSGVTYTWSFPSGWTQTAGGTTNSVTVTVGSTSGTIQVTPSNSCGNGTAQTLAVTTSIVPSQPSAITGSSAPCQSSSQTYSVTNVSGITYTWSFPSDWNQTSGGTSNSVTVTVGLNSGNIQVVPSNSCGTGTARTLAVTTSSVPAQPGAITGSTTVCQGTSQTYSVSNSSGVTYTWSFPSGWSQTGGGTTNSVTVTVGATSGNIQVTPSNACGNGTAQLLAVTANPIPAAAGAISGSATVCQGNTGVAYSVNPISNATSYTWSYSGTGATINGTGSSITIDFGPYATSGNLTVKGTNSCGNGTISANYAITVNSTPTTTGTTICRGGSGTISAVSSCPAGTPTSAGPNNAGTGAASGSGTAWSNPGNITTSGSPYTTVSLSPGANSNSLIGTNYNFAIPANAEIKGIQVSINRTGGQSVGFGFVDQTLYLVKNGIIQTSGSNNASSTTWPTSLTIANYGSTNDLWGNTWTAADINNANFGVALNVHSNLIFSTLTATVDYMHITVTYAVDGEIDWYTVASGGSPIGSGSPFNPVGVAGSGLPNTNTPGTYTFYAGCSTGTGGCRAATEFIITSPPVPTISGPASACATSTVTYTTEAGMSNYTWSITGGTGSSATNSINVTWGTGSTGNVSVAYASSGCGLSDPENYSVIIDPLPSVNAGPDISVNQGTAYTVSGASAGSSPVLWTSSGSGTLTDASTLTPTYTPLPGETSAVVLTLSVGSAPCISTDDMVIYFIPQDATWTGYAYDNDWHTSFNWDVDAVPGAITNVTIPGDLFGNYPTINNSAECNNITVESGGSLIDNGNLVVHGTANVKRDIPTDFAWHFLSSPVSNQAIWPSFTPTPSGDPLTYGNSPWSWDLYYWNPNASITSGLYWVNIRKDEFGAYNSRDIEQSGNEAGYGAATISSPPELKPGRGYMVAYGSGWGSTEHTFSGTLNTGTINHTITNGANPYNLVGNPYASSIDWQASTGWNRSNLQLNGSGYDYWIWNDADGAYGAFNSDYAEGTGTHNVDRYIAPTQAFFVVASASGLLTMDNSVRTHSIQPWLKSTNSSPEYLRLKLTTNQTRYFDELVVLFNSNAPDGGTAKWWSLYPEAPEMYTLKDGNYYCIDRHGDLAEDAVVDVYTKIPSSGTYTIEATSIADFVLSSKVLLEDLKTGITVNLKTNPSYSFAAEPGDDPKRFHLIVASPNGMSDPVTSGINIYSVGHTIYLDNEKFNGKFKVEITNMLGQTVMTRTFDNDSLNRIEMNEMPGVYIVTVMNDGKFISKKVVIR